MKYFSRGFEMNTLPQFHEWNLLFPFFLSFTVFELHCLNKKIYSPRNIIFDFCSCLAWTSCIFFNMVFKNTTLARIVVYRAVGCSWKKNATQLGLKGRSTPRMVYNRYIKKRKFGPTKTDWKAPQNKQMQRQIYCAMAGERLFCEPWETPRPIQQFLANETVCETTIRRVLRRRGYSGRAAAKKLLMKSHVRQKKWSGVGVTETGPTSNGGVFCSRTKWGFDWGATEVFMCGVDQVNDTTQSTQNISQQTSANLCSGVSFRQRSRRN